MSIYFLTIYFYINLRSCLVYIVCRSLCRLEGGALASDAVLESVMILYAGYNTVYYILPGTYIVLFRKCCSLIPCLDICDNTVDHFLPFRLAALVYADELVSAAIYR